jgi:hypothetical protein
MSSEEKKPKMTLSMKRALDGEGSDALIGTEFDPSVSWSFYNVLPDSSVTALNKIDPSWFTKDEDYLEQLCSPSASMNRIRYVFWRTYNKCKDSPDPTINWYKLSQSAGVSLSSLLGVLNDPKKLVWVLCPVVSHHEAMTEVYVKALKRMREALDLSLVNPDGGMDAKAVQQVVKIFELLDKRAHGEFAQSITVKSDSQITHVKDDSVPTTARTIDQELMAIEEEMKQKGITSTMVDSPKVVPIDERQPNHEYDRLKAEAGKRGIKIKAPQT